MIAPAASAPKISKVVLPPGMEKPKPDTAGLRALGLLTSVVAPGLLVVATAVALGVELCVPPSKLVPGEPKLNTVPALVFCDVAFAVEAEPPMSYPAPII